MGGRDSLITGNKISGTGQAGIYAVTDGGAAQACQGLVISDNIVVSATGDAGIRIASVSTALWRDVIIRGNVVRAAGSYGIRADFAPGVIIDGNRISDSAGGGVLAQECDRAHVTGNSILSAGSNAINIAGCSYGVVNSNLIDGTDSNHGIAVGASTSPGGNVVVEGNQIRSASNAGIRITTTGCFVTGNQVRKDGGTTASGVNLSSGATGCVIAGNDLSGNAWAGATA